MRSWTCGAVNADGIHTVHYRSHRQEISPEDTDAKSIPSLSGLRGIEIGQKYVRATSRGMTWFFGPSARALRRVRLASGACLIV